MPYDLFISYSRRDNEQARITRLVECIKKDFATLTGRPLGVFFDLTQIHGMDDWRHRIQRGLRECRLLLVCLSPAYFQSEYCVWEFNEYLKHETGRAQFGDGVAPLYLMDSPDWEHTGHAQPSADWIKELRRRQHIDLRRWFQAGGQVMHDAELQEKVRQLNVQLHTRIRRWENAEHNLGNVEAHNHHFIGRNAELHRLHEHVALGEAGVITVVHGIGGMGKTSLAVEYAHTFAHEFGGGRWQVHCEGRQNLDAVVTELAVPLRIEFDDNEKKDSDRQFRRVIAELRRRADDHEPRRCLLLLDNVDKSELLEPTQIRRLPNSEWLRVLVTTRLGSGDLQGEQGDRVFLAVNELLETEALDLLETYQPGRMFPNDREREAAREIVNQLGRLTLAVETAAVYLGQLSGDVTCTAFLARLKKEGLGGLDAAAQHTSGTLFHGEKRLAVTLSPTLEQLNEPEKIALSYAALLPADQIALPWVRALVAGQFPEFGRDAEPGYPDSWITLLRHLLDLHLMHVTGIIDTEGRPLVVRMHRLLQELIAQRTSFSENEGRSRLIQHAAARATFLQKGWIEQGNRWEFEPLRVFSEQSLSKSGSEACFLATEVGLGLADLGRLAEAEALIRHSIAAGAVAWDSRHANGITQASNLCNLLGRQAKYSEAEPLARELWKVSEESLGLDHPVTATVLVNLAEVLRETGNYKEAEPLARRALADRERLFGVEHIRTLEALNNLAMLLQQMGSYGEAESLSRRVCASNERVLGPDHPKTLRALNNRSQLFRDMGKYAEAERLSRSVWQASERVLGADHPETLTAMANVALLLQQMGNCEEAEPLARRACEAIERVFGPKHPNTMKALNNLALPLRQMGKYEEATLLLRRTLEISEQVLGSDHPDTINGVNNLAVMLRETGGYAEAETLSRRAWDVNKRVLGSDHPNTLVTLANLAVLLHQMGKSAEAEPLARHAWELHKQALGPDHPNTLGALAILAALLVQLGNYEEAEPLIRQSWEDYKRVLGPEHPFTLTALANLASMLQQIGKYEQAEPLANLAWESNQRVLGAGHPDTLQVLNNLSVLLQEMGKYEQAESLARRAWKANQRALGQDHPNSLLAMTNLAMLLQQMGNYAEAEPLSRRAWETLERVLGPDHPNTLGALNNFAMLLQQMGNYGESEPLSRRVVQASERLLGADHPNTLQAVSNLALLLQETGKYEEAEPLARRAWEASERVLGPEHPKALPALANLAMLLHGIGNFQEAKVLLRRALEYAERQLGSQHPDTDALRLSLEACQRGERL